MKTTIVCTEFRAVDGGGKLAGFAKVRFAELKMTIGNVPIWRNPDGYSASVPMFKNGQPVKDGDGRTKYQAIIQFDSKEVERAFAARVVDAIKPFDPRALP
jgi:hypothetical protein